jgi:hypothetical protein
MSQWAVRLALVLGKDADSAKNVLAPGDWFQVRRIDAAAVAAEVIQGESVRDRTHGQLVRDPVGVRRPCRTTWEVAAEECPVPPIGP